MFGDDAPEVSLLRGQQGAPVICHSRHCNIPGEDGTALESHAFKLKHIIRSSMCLLKSFGYCIGFIAALSLYAVRHC